MSELELDDYEVEPVEQVESQIALLTSDSESKLDSAESGVKSRRPTFLAKVQLLLKDSSGSRSPTGSRSPKSASSSSATVLSDSSPRSPKSMFGIQGFKSRTTSPKSIEMSLPSDHCTGNAEEKRQFREVWKNAKDGSIINMFILARMYETGCDGVVCDIGEAIFWYSRGADSDSNMAFSLGLLHYTGHSGRIRPNFPEALHWFRKSADKYNQFAALYMGFMYYFGEGTADGKSDFEHAFVWTRTSAKLGCDHAKNNLALFYLLGIGTPIDITRAVKWMRRASLSGIATGAFNLALFQKKGIGMSASECKASKIIADIILTESMGSDTVLECFQDELPLLDRGGILPPIKITCKL